MMMMMISVKRSEAKNAVGEMDGSSKLRLPTHSSRLNVNMSTVLPEPLYYSALVLGCRTIRKYRYSRLINSLGVGAQRLSMNTVARDWEVYYSYLGQGVNTRNVFAGVLVPGIWYESLTPIGDDNTCTFTHTL